MNANDALNDDEDIRGELDERLLELFDEDLDSQRAAVFELLDRIRAEDDLEDALIDALDASISEGGDITMGTCWIAVILGEFGSIRAVPLLKELLFSEDEVLVAAAVRSLRKIGDPAFQHVLDALENDELEGDAFAAALQVLEGIAIHDLPLTRHHIEERLLRFVQAPRREREGERRAEAAALSLARLGVRRAIEAIEHAHTVIYRRSNSFLQEALELLNEHPNGVPCVAEKEWFEEFRWAFATDPGGELTVADDEER
ncbi:MAG: HEAT repeat domain-containing protein [Planctomycetota bacterium]